jgi:DNA-binding beta-propeller fold protein YncE
MISKLLSLGAAIFLLSACACSAKPSLALIRSIPLPDVRGRIDHFAMDAQNQRLFLAALGNGTVEVVDLTAARRTYTITNFSTPQGLAYVSEANRLFIANGGNGTVQMLDGTSFKTLKTIGQLPDSDNVRYDPKAGLIYVGYGDGALSIIGATNGELIASIPLAGHPESFQLEQNGNRIFVNVPDANQIAVVDRDKRAVITTWPMTKFHSNFPMALDESNHRLFIGCRHPARLLVLDTATGMEVSSAEISGDTDDVFYDAARKRLYLSCGEGFIDVLDQKTPNAYQLREKIPSRAGARTSFFSPELKQFYLAVPQHGKKEAEIQVYKEAN